MASPCPTSSTTRRSPPPRTPARTPPTTRPPPAPTPTPRRGTDDGGESGQERGQRNQRDGHVVRGWRDQGEPAEAGAHHRQGRKLRCGRQCHRFAQPRRQGAEPSLDRAGEQDQPERGEGGEL